MAPGDPIGTFIWERKYKANRTVLAVTNQGYGGCFHHFIFCTCEKQGAYGAQMLASMCMKTPVSQAVKATDKLRILGDVRRRLRRNQVCVKAGSTNIYFKVFGRDGVRRREPRTGDNMMKEMRTLRILDGLRPENFG